MAKTKNAKKVSNYNGGGAIVAMIGAAITRPSRCKKR